MRSLVFLTLVVETCYAANKCGKGPVDLSGVKPFSVSINCPGNKALGGIEMGCVTKPTAGQGGDQTQRSNVFVINPCGVFTKIEKDKNYPKEEPKCTDEKNKFPNTIGFEITKDIETDGKPDTVNCYSVGSSTKRNFTLLDPDNPDEGVKAIYHGGSDANCQGKTRSFEVNFHCSLQNNDMYNDVEEPDQSKCSYVMHYNTIHACPSYCVTGNTICNGNGICGHHAEPCLCDTGFTGTKCETPGYPLFSAAPQGYTVAAALLAVGILLLAALLSFLLYMWIKLRRLAPVDTEAYSTLTSKFNELGQIT